MRLIFRIAAWTLLAAIAVFTDGPLFLRPETGLSPNIERFVGLAAVGLLFAVAYPKRCLLIFELLVIAVCSFEYVQQFVHYRHGTTHDAVIKCVGAAAGIMMGVFVNAVSASSKRST
jgi:hypothetical protein